MLCLGAFIADIVPRTLWRSRGQLRQFKDEATLLIREHWTRERITLVVLGLICFYVTYVSYRNLKNFLPFVRAGKTRQGDFELHKFDQWLLFGHDPALILHTLLGTTFSAHVLSYVYLWFLPMVPLVVTAWLVWARNLSYGYWFVTSQCLAWTFGTISYYALPTLGPGFEYPQLYTELAATPSEQLMNSLSFTRADVMAGTVGGAVQSVAGFASLHTAITLLVALMVQYTVRNRYLRIAVWANFGITVVATLYFGWHYIADDVAGALIALASFYLGGLASGQKFERGGLGSHPTTTTSQVPVLKD
jgi:hypothetical protein